MDISIDSTICFASSIFCVIVGDMSVDTFWLTILGLLYGLAGSAFGLGAGACRALGFSVFGYFLSNHFFINTFVFLISFLILSTLLVFLKDARVAFTSPTPINRLTISKMSCP